MGPSRRRHGAARAIAMKCIEVGGRRIGPGQPAFIIAEAGVNHNGSFRTACMLIDAAAAAGADAVKFQTWVTDKLILPATPLAAYQHRNLRGKQTQYEMLKALELTYPTFRRLKRHAKKRGIIFLSTPDEESSADFLETIDVPLFKIGSGEITNLGFLNYVARKRRPVILSTGMSTLAEVKAAVTAIEAANNRKLILLHCVSNYPAPPADCNLAAMDTLHAAFGYPVGFSDHTLGTLVAIAAVAKGACVLEKHLTLNRKMRGPDHRSSLNPSEFARLIRAVREVESAIGNGQKVPVASELPIKKLVQKVLVSARALNAGSVVRSEDVILRRASVGLTASQLRLVVGKKARKSIPALTPIRLHQLQ